MAIVKIAAPAVDHGKLSSHIDMDSDSDDESTTAASMSCVSHASHDSHDVCTPGPSCMKGSAAYRGAERSGTHLRFDDDVDISCFEPEGSMRRYKGRDKEGILQRRPQRKLDQLEREENKHSLLASAFNMAKCLSHSHGYPVHYGWPVEWTGTQAKFYQPPHGGLICEAFVSYKNMASTGEWLERGDAIWALRNQWDCFMHLGDVPDDDERNARLASGVSASPELDLEPYTKPLLVDEEDVQGVVAMPCSVELGKPVKVKSWLMDTGAALDLMDKRSVRTANRRFVKDCEAISLATANGEIDADKCVNLFVGKLAECITPILLKNTPNAMSLGRRIMINGYTFHWERYSDKPYLESADGRRIYLRVEDYCPYLDDDGGTVPIGGDADDMDVCEVIRSSIAAALRAHGIDPNGICVSVTAPGVSSPSPSASPSSGNAGSAEVTAAQVKAGGSASSDTPVVIGESVVSARDPTSGGQGVPPAAPSAGGQGVPPHNQSSSGSSSSSSGSGTAQVSTSQGVPPDAPTHSTPEVESTSRIPTAVDESSTTVDDKQGSEVAVVSTCDDSDDVAPPPKLPRDLKAEAMSLEHALTHMPYNKYCQSCVRAKMSRRPAKRQIRNPDDMPKAFGDLVNADHVISKSDEAMGLTGERDALVIVDRATDYMDCFPLQTKSAPDAAGALTEYLGTVKPKRIYTDAAPELIRACKDLRYPHDKSTPYRHQSNAYCERSVRKVVEGARTILEQSGLPSCFWIFAVRHWCFMHNVRVTNGVSPWNSRHQGGHWLKSLIPFGARVDFLPKPDSVKALPKFEPRGQPGILVGYRLHNGGQWAKDYLVFPLSYFREYDYSRPRNLLELIPIVTQECSVSLDNGIIVYPCKANYDLFKRSLPTMGRHGCIIPDITEFEDETFDDKEDSESPVESTETPPPPPTSTDEAVPADSGTQDAGDGSYYKQDAIGRWYKYDRYGNRMFAKPLKGTLKPPEVDTMDWRALSKVGKQRLASIYEHARKAGIQLSASASPSSSSSAPSVSAAARGSKANTKRTASHVHGDHHLHMHALLTCMLAASSLLPSDSDGIRNSIQRIAHTLSTQCIAADADSNEDKRHPLPSVVSAVRGDHVTNTNIIDDSNSNDGHRDGDELSGSDFVPKFPSVSARTTSTAHRSKVSNVRSLYNACVARPVKPAEARTNKAAQRAMQDEWDRLRAVVRPDGTTGVWDEHLVREWKDVRKDARRANRTVHVGRVFGIIVEKNHELDAKDLRRKYKGRAVFGGDQVLDQDHNWAIFQELGSSPATMEAARWADAYGLFPGHAVEQSDAEQAYTQAWLRGNETWVKLPRDQWPAGWEGVYHDPVVPLRLALYGHPDSGTDWEVHSQERVMAQGYEPIPNWPSCFWHPELKLLLVIYVDDFKLSGPRENLAEGWKRIRSSLKLEDPSPLGLYLGCKHVESIRSLPDTGVQVRVMEYNMEDFLRSCVARYQELTGVQYLRRATTPFLPEPSSPDFSGGYPADEEIAAAETALAEASVSELPSYAAKVLMKVLYAARYARFDLLRAVCYLAQFITKWDEKCDKRLYRLMAYIHSSYHLRMTGWIGDDIRSVSPHVFADADFAGDSKLSRSTSGVHLCLLGPNSVFPISGQSKKQGCVSHSTPEAEVVAADHALRTMGIPCLDIWSLLIGGPAVVDFHEDNETAIGAMRHGYSPALRHVGRTHGVCIRWLYERFKESAYRLYYERSALQAADIFTKAFTAPAEWDKACRLINVIDPARFWGKPRAPESGEMGEEHKGGIICSYWTSNPWLNRVTRDIPEVPAADVAAAVAVNSVGSFGVEHTVDSHVSWLPRNACYTNNTNTITYRKQHTSMLPSVVSTDVVQEPYYYGYLDEAPDMDDDDYASTEAPDSDDDETLSESEVSDPGGVSSSESQSTLPAAAGIQHSQPCVTDADIGCSRRIVEYCCGPQSRIGNLAPSDCEVIRLTADDDMTSATGLAKAVAAVSQPGIPVLLFASMPCTGGSPYVNLNWHLGPKTRSKIRAHRALFRRLWINFVVVADACMTNGGRIAIEWPRRCSYWKVNYVVSFLKRYALQPTIFDGCAYGLVSQVKASLGRPIRKAWCIASNCEAFGRLCRHCDHQKGEHVRLQGADTKSSESYTDELATAIHACWREECVSHYTHVIHDNAVVNSSGDGDDGYSSGSDDVDDTTLRTAVTNPVVPPASARPAVPAMPCSVKLVASGCVSRPAPVSPGSARHRTGCSGRRTARLTGGSALPHGGCTPEAGILPCRRCSDWMCMGSTHPMHTQRGVCEVTCSTRHSHLGILASTSTHANACCRS